VIRTGEERVACAVLLKEPKRKWGDNIRNDIQELEWEHGRG